MQPTAMLAKGRLITVDALRGFALLGIMLAHFVFWYTAGPLPEAVFNKYNDAGNQVVKMFNEILLSGKFFAFFSFLFGLSFYLQTGEKSGRDGSVVRRFAWRLTLLLLIGLMHHAFWQGDILSIYAPLGFLLLGARYLSHRWVLWTGLFLALNVPGKLMNLAAMWAPQASGGSFADFAALGIEYDKVVRSENWLPVIQYNLSHFGAKFDFQVSSGRLFVTMGFFLLGMYAGRRQWFEKGETVRPTWRKICKRSAALTGLCLLTALSIFAANALFKLGLEQNRAVGFLFSILFDVFGASLTAVYISGITLLIFRRWWQGFFHALAPVGKMALTSYLTQTIFGLLFFWGAGASMYTKTSPALNYLLALLFFYGQVLFSRWWLSRYAYGPVEWLWRSATLLRRQPMMRKPVAAALPEGVVHTQVHVITKTVD